MSGNDIMVILCTLCMGFLLVLATIAYRRSLGHKKELEDTIFKGKTSKTRYKGVSKWLNVYTTYTKMPFTKTLIDKIYKQYIMLFPNDLKLAKTRSAVVLTTLVGVSMGIVAGALLAHATVVAFAAIFIGIMIFGDAYIVNKLDKEELKLLKEFNAFMSDVRFHYMESEIVDEAVFASLENCGKLAKPHAERIYEILQADDVQEEAKRYNHLVSIPQIKAFLLVLITVQQYGDLQIDDKSLFLDNLKNITREINIEILLRDLKKSSFKLLDTVSLVPIFAIEPIESFSVGIIPELESMYYGITGLMMTIVAFCLSIGVHSIIETFKEHDKVYTAEHPTLQKLSETKIVSKILDNYESSRYNKMVHLEEELKSVGESLTPRLFVLKQMLFAVSIFCLGNLLFTGVHESSKNRIVNSTVALESEIVSTNADDLVAVLQMVPWYTNQYKGNALANEEGKVVSTSNDLLSVAGASKLVTMSGARFDASAIESTEVILNNKTLNVATIREIMACDKMIKNATTLQSAAQQVYNRIEVYHNEYYHWYELIIVLFGSVVGYWVPIIKLRATKGSAQRRMEDEVIQFQTIIMMIAFFERTTIYSILEWMNEFAVIFRDGITTCLNHMNAGDEDALDALIEEENFPMFTMLIENLKMSDRVGVSQAFNNIGIVRENFQLTREQSTQLRVKGNATIASLLVLVPFLFVIFGFLVYPYMTESNRQMTEALTEVQSER